MLGAIDNPRHAGRRSVVDLTFQSEKVRSEIDFLLPANTASEPADEDDDEEGVCVYLPLRSAEYELITNSYVK